MDILGLGKLRGRRLRIAIFVASGLCFSLFGFDQGVLGGLISLPTFLQAIGNPNPTMQGLAAAIYNIGCMIGCLIEAIWGLKLGRRKSIMLGCILVIIGGAIQSATYHIVQIIIFRIITGLGTGLISSTVPIWISEISAPKKRGQMLAIQLTVVLSGNVTAYWLDYGLSFINSTFSWRFPLAFQCIYPILALVMLSGLPESPRVLYLWDYIEEGDRVLLRLLDSGSSDEEVNDKFDKEKRQVIEGIEIEKAATQEGYSWRDLFWDNSPVRNSRRLFIVVVMQALQQLGGCNVITYYQTKLFLESVGLPLNTAKLVGGCSAIVFLVGTLPPIHLIEKLGRRKLLLYGSVATSISMAAFTILLSQLQSEHDPKIAWAAVAMIMLFEFTFANAWNCTVWVYAPELSPLKFRHINSSLAAMSEWGFTFMTVMMAPEAIARTGWRIYIFFIVFNVLQIPFVYFLCPETAGKALEEMDLMFSSEDQKTALEVETMNVNKKPFM